jgi:1-deoxy-D-xylulose-5-phosphate synthase
VAEWGDPARVDMTSSVTKSFLSTVVGLAYDRKMIRSLQDRVRDYVGPVMVLDRGARGALDRGLKVRAMVLPDRFLEHDAPEAMYAAAGLHAEAIVKRVFAALGREAASGSRRA